MLKGGKLFQKSEMNLSYRSGGKILSLISFSLKSSPTCLKIVIILPSHPSDSLTK